MQESSTDRDELDRAFETLRHPDRRQLLVVLGETGDRGGERIPVEDAFADQERRDSLHIELYHVHLPRLDEVGYVEWDRDRGEIERGPRFDRIEPLIELLDENHDVLPEAWP